MSSQSLLNAFNLQQSGGLYFESERVPAKETDITLFVGLGGTGNDELIRIKYQFHNRMKLPIDPETKLPVKDTPKNVAFLAVDTDIADIRKHHYRNTEFATDNSEILSIEPESNTTYEQIVEDLKEEKRQNFEHAQWIHYEAKPDASKDGAGGRRAIGRVSFFHHYSNIKNKVRQTLDTLAMNNPGYTSLRIFLFSGLSGGTGSGTFIDMGYLMKDVGRSVNAQCQVLGYFFLPDLNIGRGGDDEKHKSNGFAALKELDYLLECSKKGIPFTQSYSTKETDRINTTSSPFDYCHLINKSSSSSVLDYSDVLDSVAASIFNYIADENNAGHQTTPGLISLYSNVSENLTSCANRSNFPALYNYLSTSCTVKRVPYMEINTLIGCRLFEKLNKTIFINKVTDSSFNQDLLSLGLGGSKEGLQGALTQELEAEAPPVYKLTSKKYKYEKIWGKTNQAYEDAYSQWQVYQNAMDACYGTAKGKIEGLFQEYIKLAFVSSERGPFYVCNLINGFDENSLVNLLSEQGKYFRDICNQENTKKENAKRDLDRIYNEGADIHDINFVGKGAAANTYCKALNMWLAKCKTADLYDYLSQLAFSLSSRFLVYYKNILNPLKQKLEEISSIFKINIKYLEEQDRKRKKDPDPSILIHPFEFESVYDSAFKGCVDTAEKTFLSSMLSDLKYWIRYTIDDVDKKAANTSDIPGFLSRFISSCFNSLYNNLTMERILAAKNPHTQLSDYAEELFKNMNATSHPMFKQNGRQIRLVDCGILSIPCDCPIFASAAQNYINNNNLNGKITLKLSQERASISLVKVHVGYPLYSNMYLNEWEAEYESTISKNAIYAHIRYGWHKELPSPNVASAWTNGYKNDKTLEYNIEREELFDRCFDYGLIREISPLKCVLARSQNNANKDSIKLSGTLSMKSAQLKSLINRIWPQKDGEIPEDFDGVTDAKWTLLEGQGTYQENNPINNIKANIVRYPHIYKALRSECDWIDLIDRLNRDITYPYLFVKAWLCRLFEMNKLTKDVVIKHSSDPDPMGRIILNGAETTINPSDMEYYYELYKNFSNIVTQTDEDQTWNQIIANCWRAQLNKHSDSAIKANTINALNYYGKTFKNYSEYYKREAEWQSDVRIQKELENLRDFYITCFEALTVVYKQVIS